MPRCDHCKREFADKDLTASVVMYGDSQNEIRLFPERCFVLFDGMICDPCEDAIIVGIRTWCAAPQPDQPTPVNPPPTPKSAYVMTPTRPWWVRIPLAVLMNVLMGLAYGSVFLATWYYLATHSKH